MEGGRAVNDEHEQVQKMRPFLSGHGDSGRVQSLPMLPLQRGYREQAECIDTGVLQAAQNNF